MNLDELDIDRLRQRRGEKWSHYPADVLPAWVADMDFDIAAPIRAAVEQRVALSDCGYPVAAKATGLLDVFCERVGRRFDWHVEPGQVELFSDVVQAIYFGLLTLANEGDGVVIQTPIYPPFLGSTQTTGRRPVLAPLQPGERGFEIDFDALRDSIDPGTKILLLCNPHNPTGRCFSRFELEQLAELALTFDLSIISDEIHADLVFSPHRHIPIASLSPEVAARTVTLMSASKAFNIAGICLAFAVFGGERVRNAYATLPTHVRGGVSPRWTRRCVPDKHGSMKCSSTCNRTAIISRAMRIRTGPACTTWRRRQLTSRGSISVSLNCPVVRTGFSSIARKSLSVTAHDSASPAVAARGSISQRRNPSSGRSPRA